MKFSGAAKMSTCWRRLVAKITRIGATHKNASTHQHRVVPGTATQDAAQRALHRGSPFIGLRQAQRAQHSSATTTSSSTLMAAATPSCWPTKAVL